MQDKLGYIAYRCAELVDCSGGVELQNAGVIIFGQGGAWLNAQTNQRNVRYACYKLKYKGSCSLLVVHIRKNSVCCRFKKIIAIVGIVIRYGIDGRAEYGIRKAFASGACFTELVLQLFDYLSFIFRLDLPKPERSVMARIGVGHIEQILQPRFVAAVVYNGNTFGVFIYPAPEPAVPKLH